MDIVERLQTQAEHLLDVRRPAEAVAKVHEALSHRPGDPDLLVLLARIHLSTDDIDAAFDAATAANQTRVSAEGLHIVARVLRRQGDLPRALDALHAALALRPESSALHVALSLTISRPYLDDAAVPSSHPPLVDALDAARRAANLWPESASPDYALAVCDLAEHDLPGAARHLESALAKSPDWAAAHQFLGTVRTRQGMPKMASRHHAAAGRLDPGDDAALRSLRRLSALPELRMSSSLVVVGVLSAFLLQVSVGAAVAAFVVGMLGASAYVTVAKRRRRPALDRLVPEAQRIIEADLRIGDRPR